MRKLNAAITYTIVDSGVAGQAPYTVNYSNFSQGWVAGDGYGKTGLNLATYDPNNFCLNCHRADVYGYLDDKVASVSTGCGDISFPRYRYLARQPHPADGQCGGMGAGQGRSFDSKVTFNSAGNPPRGIVCLRCHGGGTVGGIHGNSGSAAVAYTYTLTNITPSSNRLLNGAAWTGVTFGSTTAYGSCTKSGATNYNTCTHTNGGNFDTSATYNY